MRRLLIMLAPASLAACSTTPGTNVADTAATTAGAVADASGLPAPNTVADKTALDEKIMLGVENAYRAARTIAEVGVDSGLIKGDRATKVARLDNQAYAAVQAMRSAYAAGNAPSYLSAASDATSAIAQIIAIGKGE